MSSLQLKINEKGIKKTSTKNKNTKNTNINATTRKVIKTKIAKTNTITTTKKTKDKILYFVTGNMDKVREAQEILTEWNIKQVNIDIPELQGTPEEVCYHKAELAFKQFKKPLFIDDTALSFDAWNGLPGVYIKHFLKQLGHDGINKALDKFESKKATALACIGYHDGKTIQVLVGSCRGTIVPPQNEGKGFGFGWDPIFSPDGYDGTFATLDTEIKNSISHRKRALEKLRRVLDK